MGLLRCTQVRGFDLWVIIAAILVFPYGEKSALFPIPQSLSVHVSIWTSLLALFGQSFKFSIPHGLITLLPSLPPLSHDHSQLSYSDRLKSIS